MNMDKKMKQEDQIEEEATIENEEVTKLKTQLEDIENKYKRAVADYQNLERRVGEQRRELIQSASKQVLLRLLPVLDTLMTAQQYVANDGLKVAVQQFVDVLKSEGAVRVETEGKKFDPNTMECIQIMAGEEGKVLQEVRAGFLLNEILLRPAQVIVGKQEEK